MKGDSERADKMSTGGRISTKHQFLRYKDLVKPSWNPPNWLFGPMWTTLYFLQAVSAFLVWKTISFKKVSEVSSIVFSLTSRDETLSS